MSGNTLRVAAAISASMFVFGTASEAYSANLFDMLFGGNRLNRSRVIKPDVRLKTNKRKVVKRVRISSPKYYTYKTDKMVRVNFAGVVASKAETSLLPTLDNDYFDEAVDALAAYSLTADKQIAAALEKYYTENRSFIWISGHHPNGKAEAALAVLADADNWGLVANEYLVDSPEGAFSMDDIPSRLTQLIRFEMTMSARVLRYAHDARQGRVDPNRLSGYHDLPRKDVSLPSVLGALADSEDVGEFLTSLHPSNERFAALRAELAAVRADEEDEIVIDLSTFVKPGRTHAEFPKVLAAIRKHATPEFLEEHGELLTTHEGNELYAPELVGLIKAAQKQHGVGADGIVGRRTVNALSGDSKAGRLDRVLLAMERLRWLPSNLGKTHVLINQPGYRVSFNSDGTEKLSMRVVVGKKANQTSFFHDEIERVVYNPYWGVPQSIIVNEMLPRLIRDPGYLDRAGYEVTNARGKRISSRAVNWGAYGSRVPFNVRQKPSAKNALGELKILFPNKHAIYMHDTPSKSLFKKDIRAFSHGCVRLEKPREMAAAVLGVSTSDIASRLKNGHSTEELRARIPVYVAYFTAWPATSGEVNYYEDIYGRDVHLKKAVAAVEAIRRPGS